MLREASRDDATAAQRRLSISAGIPILQTTKETRDLAERLLNARLLPQTAVADAFHIAIAAQQGMDFLITWNCRHIANAEIAQQLEERFLQWGYRLPLICTPEQLMGS